MYENCLGKLSRPVTKLILNETDLRECGILDQYDKLRRQLYKADLRKDCILIQGSAFVVKNYGFLLMGVGGIDYLDSLAQHSSIEGIIGNGNTMFVSKGFKMLYSAHTSDELIKCYEYESNDPNVKIKFTEEAPLGPAIFMLRSLHTLEDYERSKVGVQTRFEIANTFAKPLKRFKGSRLKEKFLRTARVVHCARRPSLEEKECLFDSYENVHEAIENYDGYAVLVYTLWNQEMCDAVGMRNTRKLSMTYNPTDPITPHMIEIAEECIDLFDKHKSER